MSILIIKKETVTSLPVLVDTLKTKVMLVINTQEFREKQGTYLSLAKESEEISIEKDIPIDKKHILEPDEDLARTMSFEEFADSAKKHIRELYKRYALLRIQKE